VSYEANNLTIEAGAAAHLTFALAIRNLKEKMKKLLVLTVILAGCASSGPVQIGNNAYMITKQSAGGIAVPGNVVKTDIIAEANTFCSKSGKQTELISSDSKNAIPFVRMSSAEITFRCI
jgi:hypothetical protein